MYLSGGQLSEETYVDFSELEFASLIGCGNFKTVYRGKCKGKEAAIAHLSHGEMLPEARLMQEIPPHPHIIPFEKYCAQPNFKSSPWCSWSVDESGCEYICMQLMKLGSLDMVLRREKISTAVKLEICSQVCRAMRHLHSLGIIHRDLSARNILVENLDPICIKVTTKVGRV